MAVRPLTVLVIPRGLIGRVLAVEALLITSASLVGGVLASTLATTVLAYVHTMLVGMNFGRLDTIFARAGVLVKGAGIFARLTLYPAVKRHRAADLPTS